MKVVVERDMIISRKEVQHDHAKDPFCRIELVGVTNAWSAVMPSLRVSVEGSASELASLDANKRIHFQLTGEAPSSQATDLLTQAATKAKAAVAVRRFIGRGAAEDGGEVMRVSKAAIEHGRKLLLEIGGNCEESWQQADKPFEYAAQLADALARCVGYPVYDEETGDYAYPKAEGK